MMISNEGESGGIEDRGMHKWPCQVGREKRKKGQKVRSMEGTWKVASVCVNTQVVGGGAVADRCLHTHTNTQVPGKSDIRENEVKQISIKEAIVP
jgi:hypothetical protein